MIRKNYMIRRFAEVFGDGSDVKVYFAPGRVNLIGEHIDYNGGYVMPCALTLGTCASVKKNNLGIVRVYSDNFKSKGLISFGIKDFQNVLSHDWANYPKGVMWAFAQKGCEMPCGLDIFYYGDLPNGSGLSSSASIEVLTAFILNDMFNFGVELKDMALWCQYSENQFNKVNCGIMDQFAIAMGKKGCAILLNTSDLSYEYIPMKLKGLRLVISYSNKKRGLGDSKYNERRSQCEQALADLKKVADINNLCDLDGKQFEKIKDSIFSPVNLKRAKHAVYENQRTKAAANALKFAGAPLMGKLMNESHVSLRDDYQVTGKELDTLAEAAWKQPGVLGSRMTGAGFGGCTISIVRTDAIDSFIENVGKIYKDEIGYEADFYVAQIGSGPCEL